jgi:hypothetical protein
LHRQRCALRVASGGHVCALRVVRAGRASRVFAPCRLQSWLFEKSATWRRIIASTRASRGNMAVFTVACFVLPAALGAVVMAVRAARAPAARARA